MINTNVRYITRGSSEFEVKGKAAQNGLCLYCASRPVCKLADQRVVRCAQYRFPIAFRDPRGTEGKFNTMRLGAAWSLRATIGDKIGLLDKNNSLYGFAIVTNVEVVEKNKLTLTHILQNHLMIGRSDVSIANMHKILRNCYGKLVFENNDVVTVISMERE